MFLGTARGDDRGQFLPGLALHREPVNTETAKRSHLCPVPDDAARLVLVGGPYVE